MTKEIIPSDPIPVNDEKLNIRGDFCACIVDPKINDRETSLTRLLEQETKTEES